MTTTILEDPIVNPILDQLLGCLELEVAKVPVPPKLACLRPGTEIALLLSKYRDECCEGLAWVRPVSVYPSTEFPEQDTTAGAAGNCGVIQWAVVVEVGVARCAPRPEADELVECSQWTADVHEIMHDAAAIRRAITCCFADLDIDRRFLPGIWTPLTVEGGCMGGFQQVVVAVPACDCVEE